MKILNDYLKFEWNKGNIDKNLIKHNVANKEAEEVFDNEPKFIAQDIKHSILEKRFQLWGVTNTRRKLTIIFTLRGKKVRIISARDMNRKERSFYEQKIKAHTKI